MLCVLCTEPGEEELTSHGVQIKQYLGNDNSGVENHQQTQNQLNWTTLKRLHRSPSASAPFTHRNHSFIIIIITVIIIIIIIVCCSMVNTI